MSSEIIGNPTLLPVSNAWYTGSGSRESGRPGFKACLLHLPACMTVDKFLNVPEP